MNNHHLHVYKASAGSGKTFTLAVNYICMLIERPDEYRHILAVTFTNKATAEMKNRILSKLYALGHNTPDGKPYFDEVKQRTHLPDDTIRQRAKEALTLLIHDYGHMRVETIDSFFQSVLRGLARELDLGSSMTIELDTRKVIGEAVDLMLRELKPGDATLDWIVNYIAEQMDEGKPWNITDDMKEFALNMHREEYQRKAEQLSHQLEDSTLIRDMRSHLMAERAKAVRRLEERAADFFSIIHDRGYSVDDFSNKRGGACGYYLKLQKGEYSTTLGARAQAAAQGAEGWVSKNSPINKELTALANELLVAHINETHRVCQECVPKIYSCDLIMHHLYQLQLIDIIHDRVLRLNREENRFLLADTCQMLSRMQTGDSAFVFEKLGYYIQHIMIDEFQDTSRMQWDNFYPLLLEGLAQGKRSLIVGDVKQAIYRWRGSDWRILNEELTRKLNNYTPTEAHRLDTNRRSCEEIVRFNNRLFDKCNTLLSELLGEQNSGPLLQAYSDVAQKWVEKNKGGYVRITNVKHDEGEKANEAMCRETASIIYELRAMGIEDRHIAILVRNNRYITHMVDYMAQHHTDIHIFSAEAYLLEASTAVNMLINALRWLADEQHRLALIELAIAYHRHMLADGLSVAQILESASSGYGLPPAFIAGRNVLLQTPLYELCETLYQLLNLHSITSEDGYVMAFFDRLLAWCTDTTGNITDFVRYWDDELHATSTPSGTSDGIEAMTIHKSKGLEFNTVILPYCDWELNKAGNTLWVETDHTLASSLATIPVRYSQKMQESIFAPQYEEERLQQTVDNYNLLYVACTRPKANLFILKGAGRVGDEKKKRSASSATSPINSVAQLIDQALQMDKEEAFIEYGQLIAEHNADEAPASASVNPLEATPNPISVTMHSEPLSVTFRQSNLSKRFVSGSLDTIPNEGSSPESQQPTTLASSYLDRGLLLHELFSRMRTSADAASAIDDLTREGLIGDDTTKKELARIVNNALKNPQAAEWFSGRYELFNECSIIYTPGTMPPDSLCYEPDMQVHTLRPDRVMLQEGKIIVVDFKFARPTDEHLKQVARYMELLRNMGHTHVEGYVWYGYENRIVPV